MIAMWPDRPEAGRHGDGEGPRPTARPRADNPAAHTELTPDDAVVAIMEAVVDAYKHEANGPEVAYFVLDALGAAGYHVTPRPDGDGGGAVRR